MTEERITDYRNNCVLVAAKEITGKPDALVLAAVRRHNYKNNHGMFDRDWMPAMKELGAMFGPELSRFHFERTAREQGKRLTFTVNQALKHTRDGVYLVRTRGHVLVSRNGRLVDHNYRYRAALRRECVSIQKVLNPHEPPKTGLLKMVRRHTRKFGSRTWKAYEEAALLLSRPERLTREQLLARCSEYNATDLAWDIRRGNIVEETA